MSALSPFKYRVFLVMWCATLISSVGTWMHSVGAGWLMTELSPSAMLVSLVQTATTLPVFIFALPAGALADIFNKRWMLVITNSLMLCSALAFALLVWNQAITPNLLLLFSFLLGIGAAFMAPAWQAVIPQLIPRQELPQAVALSGISINISRAIGPALAGLLITVIGLSAPFFVNALSFVFIIAALLWWQDRQQRNSELPPEKVWQAMKVGLSHAVNNPSLKATMLHIFVFMFFANAFWALLPVIAREQLGGDASYFGILMGFIGVGAVSTALVLPKIKRALSPNQTVLVGTIGVALITLYFAFASSKIASLALCFVFGMGWILVLATINVSAQQALPDWVRARGLAVFMMIFFGGISAGSVFWGWLADMSSISTSLTIAAIGSVVGSLLIYGWQLQQGASMDLTPSRHWPTPHVHEQVSFDQGPVKIVIHYQIDDANREEFLSMGKALKASRRRHGAYHWGLYEDAERHGHFIEHFMELSWANHLRHHEQVTNQDRPLHDKVRALHAGASAPRVEHYLLASRGK